MKITICGSMSTVEAMSQAERQLITAGFEVEKPNFAEKQLHVAYEKDATKKRGFIDEHFAKIDVSDAILVTNLAKNGIEHYIGGNTLMEMAHAYASGLETFLLHDIPDVGYRDEIAGMHPIILDGDLDKLSEYFAALPTAYISSESPVKRLAVSRAFRRAGIPVQTHAQPLASGVSEQPASIDETYEGALNRHQQLVKKLGQKTGDYFVTIESGIFTPRSEHDYFGTTVIVVEKEGERHVGIDTDIEFPRQMTDRVPSEFKDLGALVKAEYGATTSDPYPYLTKGRLTRANILENALHNVLIQFRD